MLIALREFTAAEYASCLDVTTHEDQPTPLVTSERLQSYMQTALNFVVNTW
jgi:hypothetical protein